MREKRREEKRKEENKRRRRRMKKEEEKEKEKQRYGIYICLDYVWNTGMESVWNGMELMFRSVVSWYKMRFMV